MITLNRLDLMHQYYVEEWTIERISTEMGCTRQTIHNRRVMYDLPSRDRDWTSDDDRMVDDLIPLVTMGASLIGDMRTMASDLKHRTSTRSPPPACIRRSKTPAA